MPPARARTPHSNHPPPHVPLHSNPPQQQSPPPRPPHGTPPQPRTCPHPQRTHSAVMAWQWCPPTPTHPHTATHHSNPRRVLRRGCPHTAAPQRSDGLAVGAPRTATPRPCPHTPTTWVPPARARTQQPTTATPAESYGVGAHPPHGNPRTRPPHGSNHPRTRPPPHTAHPQPHLTPLRRGCPPAHGSPTGLGGGAPTALRGGGEGGGAEFLSRLFRLGSVPLPWPRGSLAPPR